MKHQDMTTDLGQVVRVPKAGGSSTVLADRPGAAFELDVESGCVSFAVTDAGAGAGEIVKVATE